jgi:hypothetical protein
MPDVRLSCAGVGTRDDTSGPGLQMRKQRGLDALPESEAFALGCTTKGSMKRSSKKKPDRWLASLVSGGLRQWVDDITSPLPGESILNVVLGAFSGAALGIFYSKYDDPLPANSAVYIIAGVVEILLWVCLARISSLAIAKKRALTFILSASVPVYISISMWIDGLTELRTAMTFSTLTTWLIGYWVLGIFAVLWDRHIHQRMHRPHGP